MTDAPDRPVPAPSFQLPRAAPTEPWAPVIVRAAALDAEIERLATLDPAEVGPGAGRETWFVHPSAPPHAPGLAPGIGVGLEVLLPGEQSPTRRTNATEVHFCIRGEGQARVGEAVHRFARYDAFNVPGHRAVSVRNDGTEVSARLVYTNRPLLQLLGVHVTDAGHLPSTASAPAAGAPAEPQPSPTQPSPTGPIAGPIAGPGSTASPFGTFPLEGPGEVDGDRPDVPWLMPYERLIHPPPVASPSLHWRWVEVQGHLDALEALGSDYVGRRLYLLYNPRTGGTNGTTPNFFATITMRPPGIVDRPHRHVSAAINYFFAGHGRSVVGGRTYTWAAGDLMFTAPGWMIHHHASDPDSDPVYELTVQDQPLHIAMESLLWQEDLKRPAVLLGIDAGFTTNRADLADGDATAEEDHP